MKKYDDNNLDLIRAYVRVCSKLEQFEEGLQLIQNYETKNKNQMWNSSLCHWKILLHYHMGNYT